MWVLRVPRVPRVAPRANLVSKRQLLGKVLYVGEVLSRV